MELCLQHPVHGYYRKAEAVGAEGDFITAPEISQLFGDLVGLWLIHAWKECGAPGKAALLELGPGRGTLAADVMRMLQKNGGSRGRFHLHLLESNATLRKKQAEKLWAYEPVWHETLESLPRDLPLFILANEFFDALPIRQWVGDEQRRIGLTAAGELCFTPEEGPVTAEDSPQSTAIMRALADRLKHQGGVMLLADYGYESLEPSPLPRLQTPDSRLQIRDTFQAVKNHVYCSPLEHPGEADLTAHVDFTALAAVAREAGLQVHGPVGQGVFLQRIGGEIWLQKLLAKAPDDAARKRLEEGWLRLVSPLQMGELFKIMALSPQAIDGAGLR